MRASLLCAATLLVLAGCDRFGRDAGAGGTVVITTSADAGTLIPVLVDDIQGKQVIDQVFDRLAQIGEDINTVGDDGFVPQLARRWEWGEDSLSIVFHLDPDARWHDGAPVRASDVRFTHQLYRDPAVASPHAAVVANVDSITIRDSATVVAWFAQRTPEQFFEVTYQLMIHPEHLLRDVPRDALATSPFARNPIGSGRFRFVAWQPGASIEVMADTANYRGRAKLDRVIWSIAPDPTAAVTKLLAGEADFYEALRREQLPEVQKHPDLRALRFAQLAYAFVGFNLRDPLQPNRPHPLFADRELRRALARSVDRARVVRSVFDTLAFVGVGPYTRGLSTADTSIAQLPYDTVGAKKSLDSLGWRDDNEDGVRERNGRPLRFTLLVPVSSSFRVRMALLLQEELRRVGVDMKLEQLEFNTWSERQDAGRYDATFGAWTMDPSPAGIRQTFTSAGAAPGGLNYGKYVSAGFDAAVDSALTSMDPEDSRASFRRAYETIIQDAPALFMYELPGLAGAHRRLQITGMRPDAWWGGLADWTIAADQRIARDGIGLRTVMK
jgi:peptide/nickel transport system substrate-binding protein